MTGYGFLGPQTDMDTVFGDKAITAASGGNGGAMLLFKLGSVLLALVVR